MDSFEYQLNDLMMKVYRSLETLEEEMLRTSKHFQLTISEIHTLEAVAASDGEDGASISDISDYLGISLPSVTMAINKLVGKGFVTKQKCSNDGRVVRAVLTRDGRRAEHAHRYFHRSMARSLSKELTEAERQDLLKGIGKLDEFLESNIRKYEEMQ